MVGKGPLGTERIGKLTVFGTTEVLEVLVGKSGRALPLLDPLMSAAIGISIVVGVGSSLIAEETGDDVSRRSVLVAGES